jgi:hypothetical protein
MQERTHACIASHSELVNASVVSQSGEKGSASALFPVTNIEPPIELDRRICAIRRKANTNTPVFRELGAFFEGTTWWA